MNFPVYIDKEVYRDHLINILNIPESNIIKIYPKYAPFFICNDDGLSFVIDSSQKKLIHIDFLRGQTGWRIKRTDHESLLKKALGKNNKELRVFDATAGFLSDSLIFLALGHKVIACEQSMVLFLLLNDAIYRAKEELNFLENLELLNGNAIEIYKQTKNIDVIYLDPMYPENKKNVLRSGNINYIKKILKIEKIDNLEDKIFFDFKKNDFKKIILKRPIKSKIIDDNLNYQIKGKSTRFDIYI